MIVLSCIDAQKKILEIFEGLKEGLRIKCARLLAMGKTGADSQI
jgi:hypothetical protein